MQLIAKLNGADTIPSYGPLPISVPGCVDAWFMLHEVRQQGLGRVCCGPAPLTTALPPFLPPASLGRRQRFGRLPMEQLLAPTIQYAREGFPVGQVVSHYWRRFVGRGTPGTRKPGLSANTVGRLSCLLASVASAITNYLSAPVQRQLTSDGAFPSAFDGFRNTFAIDGTRGPNDGEIFRNPELANTLERIAQGGRDVFYEGEIGMVCGLAGHDGEGVGVRGMLTACPVLARDGHLAWEIDEWARNVAGVPLRYEDFATHHGEWVTPLNTTYRNVRVFELPPNGQGLAALQILNILEGYDLAAMGFNSPDYLHVAAEAKKLAYADRAVYYADPDFGTPTASNRARKRAHSSRARQRCPRPAWPAQRRRPRSCSRKSTRPSGAP